MFHISKIPHEKILTRRSFQEMQANLKIFISSPNLLLGFLIFNTYLYIKIFRLCLSVSFKIYSSDSDPSDPQYYTADSRYSVCTPCACIAFVLPDLFVDQERSHFSLFSLLGLCTKDQAQESMVWIGCTTDLNTWVHKEMTFII